MQRPASARVQLGWRSRLINEELQLQTRNLDHFISLYFAITEKPIYFLQMLAVRVTGSGQPYTFFIDGVL